jgi:AcrR family transcriptional regulator
MPSPLLPEDSSLPTKARILSAALDGLLQHGPDHISMRQIAGEVGITPMAIYKHFANKEALQLALLEAGYLIFEEYLSRHRDTADSRQRLRLLAQSFFDFSIEQAGYFELIFLSGRGLARIKGWEVAIEAAKPTYQMLHQCVRSCIKDGLFSGDDSRGTTTSMLAFCVGMSALYLSGAIGGTTQQAGPRFMTAFDRYLDQLCAATPAALNQLQDDRWVTHN